VFYSVANF